MSILISIFTLIGITGLVCVFWWAMIEAQKNIPGINEPNNKGGADLHANARKGQRQDR